MTVLTEVVKNTLANDATLAALLTGGVFDAEDEQRAGGGAKSAPRLADGARVEPYAMLRWRAANRMADAVNALMPERETLEIYNYQNKGYVTIHQAIAREMKLLNDQYLAAEDREIAHFLYLFTSGEVPAPEVGKAPCKFVRFQIVTIRK